AVDDLFAELEETLPRRMVQIIRQARVVVLLTDRVPLPQAPRRIADAPAETPQTARDAPDGDGAGNGASGPEIEPGARQGDPEPSPGYRLRPAPGDDRFEPLPAEPEWEILPAGKNGSAPDRPDGPPPPPEPEPPGLDVAAALGFSAR